MLSLVFAESALETIPVLLQKHRSVHAHARKLQKHPSEILLDNSWHYAAMKGMDNETKRGRPDIVFLNMLEATTIPLYFENKIKIYIHTIDDKVITVGSNVNLPKSYHRFAGLMEKLYVEKTITGNDQKLLDIQNMSFVDLLEKIDADKTIGLSTQGHKSSAADVAAKLDEETCLIIGSFQKGHFAKSVNDCIDELYSIGSDTLTSHIVTSRILYEYEKTIFM